MSDVWSYPSCGRGLKVFVSRRLEGINRWTGLLGQKCFSHLLSSPTYPVFSVTPFCMFSCICIKWVVLLPFLSNCNRILNSRIHL